MTDAPTSRKRKAEANEQMPPASKRSTGNVRNRPGHLTTRQLEVAEQFHSAIALLGGSVVGQYKKASEKVHCLCAQGHDCYPTPCRVVREGRGICRKCMGLCPEEAEKAFRASVEEKGGRVMGEYVRNNIAVHCICSNGHDCYPLPYNIQQGRGMCLKCVGQCPEAAEQAFKASITAQGGRVVGAYIRTSDGVHCICSNGHDCHPIPNSIQQGSGMCIKCAGLCSDEAGKAFKASITAQGGRVVGQYIRNSVGVHCICSNGHDCHPIPHSIQQGNGMCRKCAGNCPEAAEKAFKESIAVKGGHLVGEYIRNSDAVHCICANGHDCYPIPANVQRGQGFCIKCAGHCPEQAEEAFHEFISAQGGRVIGRYVDSQERVQCICAVGHECYPIPNAIQQGKWMCRKCAPSSYGEHVVASVLDALGVDYQVEFRFKPDRRRYDFCIENERIIIEFDGCQHFKVGGFMKTKHDLLANQENDRQKQSLALARGFRVMRFDFEWSKQANHSKIAEKIQWFLRDSTDSVWVSNPDLYIWIL